MPWQRSTSPSCGAPISTTATSCCRSRAPKPPSAVSRRFCPATQNSSRCRLTSHPDASARCLAAESGSRLGTALTTRAGPHSGRGRASPVRQARRGRPALPARLGGQPRERISPTRPCRHLRSRLPCPACVRIDVGALCVYVQGSCQHRLTHPHSTSLRGNPQIVLGSIVRGVPAQTHPPARARRRRRRGPERVCARHVQRIRADL